MLDDTENSPGVSLGNVPRISFPPVILNLQGRVCRLLSVGVGLPGPSSVEIVLGCDVGELQQPGLPG